MTSKRNTNVHLLTYYQFYSFILLYRRLLCRAIKGENTLIVMMATELFQVILENTLSLNEGVKDSLHLREKENITGALDRLTGPLQRIDEVREETMDLLMERAILEKARAWSKSRKDINSYL